MRELPGQVSLFGLLPPDNERAEKLREACRWGSGYEGSRVRIWAMIESGKFPQYRERWMQSEFGTGGHSMEGHWFADYNSKGMRVHSFRDGREYSYTWKEVICCMEELINIGDFLTKRDERKISEIAQSLEGGLPYPRAKMAYPDCAWGVDDTPIMRSDDYYDDDS